MTRQLRIAILSGLFLLPSLAMVYSVRAQGTGSGNPPASQPSVQSQRPSPAPERTSDQMTDIPYFTLRDGFSSRLTLNNNAPTPTLVSVTIFNTEGRGQALNPITLGPHSVKQIELRDVVVSEMFNEGNISVAYYGKEMDITCQVSVYSLKKRVSFESREQGMMDFQSSNSNGILWLPQIQAEGFLAITNVSKNKVKIQLSLGSKTSQIALDSRETRLIKLDEEFGLHPPVAELVKLSHDGLPSDIITTGFALDLESGYSSAFMMVDPKNMRSNHLAGAHFRFGPPTANEVFPPGTNFTSPLLLANVSDKPVSAHVSIDYTVREKLKMSHWNTKEEVDSGKEGGAPEYKFGTLTVKDLTIAPGAVARVELSEALEKRGIDRIEEAGVDIDYIAPPGSLIGHLVSADQTGDYSFEVPIKDPTAWNAMIEGINPWTLEDGTKTVLHLKNTTDQVVHAWVSFTFVGGRYNLPLVSFQPYETVAVDIQKLKDSQEPDAQGLPFPATATHGQAVWFPETPYTLVGRAEQTNLSQGIARSFSCLVNCCTNFWEQACVSTAPCSPDDIFGHPIAVSGLTGSVGGSGTLKSYKYGHDCNDNILGPIDLGTFPVPVWTYDSSVISVNSSGLVNYLHPGSTAVGRTNAPVQYYDWFQECICHQHSADWITFSEEQAPVNVNPPNHVKVVNDVQGFTTCPAGLTAVDARQIHMQIIDVNNAVLTTNYAVHETFSAQSSNTCGSGNAVGAMCQTSGPTFCLNCTGGEFSDTMSVVHPDVNGNFCSAVNPATLASNCGYSITSTWGMCSNGLTNGIWTYNGVTKSLNITVNNTTHYNPGTMLF